VPTITHDQVASRRFGLDLKKDLEFVYMSYPASLRYFGGSLQVFTSARGLPSPVNVENHM
jgi:hypothetical protein